MPGDWANFGRLAVGAGRTVPGEFFGFFGDASEEAEKDGVWAVLGLSICSNICV